MEEARGGPPVGGKPILFVAEEEEGEPMPPTGNFRRISGTEGKAALAGRVYQQPPS